MSTVNPGPQRSPDFDAQLQQLLHRTRLRALGHGLIRLGAVGGLMVVLATWSLGGKMEPGVFNGWGLSLSVGAGLMEL